MNGCITPFLLSDKDSYMNHGKTIAVPCGKCPACRKRRVSGWSFRLMQEEKLADSAYFVTLTYNNENINLTKRGWPTLALVDVQCFIKRLRRRTQYNRDKFIRGLGNSVSYRSGVPPEPKPTKYYAVGEYGGRTMRPHYHLIIFNCNKELIESAWGKGDIHVGKVTGASIGYTLKYISKNGKIPLHANDDRVPEFSLMSKGLGKSYITKNVVNWHKKVLTERMYCVAEGGKKIAMPRYYKDKIYEPCERSIISGFHKGQLEQSDIEFRNLLTDKSARQQVESHKAQFRRMHAKSIEGNKI